MFNQKKINFSNKFIKYGLTSTLICSSLSPFIGLNKPVNSSGLEFRWDQSGNYKKLKYLQSSRVKLERSTYFFILKKSDRQSAILKLNLKFPDYFKATIKPKHLKLCKIKIGGYKGRTKCLEKIPSVFEVSEDMKSIDVFPDKPIPVDKKPYAVVLKMYNPRKTGMYQINAFSQSPGELPVSLYVGSYLIEIEN